MARRLIQAGEAKGDKSVPGLDSMCHNLYRWVRHEVAVRREALEIEEVQDLLAGLSQQPGGSWAQPDPGDAGEGGKQRWLCQPKWDQSATASSADKAGTVWDWAAPVILEALIPGRMQSHASTAEIPEVPRGAVRARG
jgi:hypothetical protein